MIAIIQRVRRASVEIAQRSVGKIEKGILVLVGITSDDGEHDISWLSQKIVNMRIFNDAAGVMNVSVKDDGGDVLVVSQFTLHASTKKGNRPSYSKAAKPEIAIPIYNAFKRQLAQDLEKDIQCGEFGADMMVSLDNDGPVTIIINTKNKE